LDYSNICLENSCPSSCMGSAPCASADALLSSLQWGKKATWHPRLSLPVPFHSIQPLPSEFMDGPSVQSHRLSPATDLNFGVEKPTSTSVTAFVISSYCVTRHSYRSSAGSVFTTWVRSHPPMSTTFLTNLWTGAFSPRKTNRASTLRAWQGLTA
jgi:hypothetical protein